MKGQKTFLQTEEWTNLDLKQHWNQFMEELQWIKKFRSHSSRWEVHQKLSLQCHLNPSTCLRKKTNLNLLWFRLDKRWLTPCLPILIWTIKITNQKLKKTFWVSWEASMAVWKNSKKTLKVGWVKLSKAKLGSSMGWLKLIWYWSDQTQKVLLDLFEMQWEMLMSEQQMQCQKSFWEGKLIFELIND